MSKSKLQFVRVIAFIHHVLAIDFNSRYRFDFCWMNFVIKSALTLLYLERVI